MAVSRLRQDQIHTEGSGITDTLTPTDHDANAVDLKDSLDYLASQIADITGNVAWETAPALSLAAIDAKTFLDEKLALRRVWSLTDVSVPASQNYVLMTAANIPSVVKATSGSTKGLVSALHDGTFGTSHSLAEVNGNTAINPKNLLMVVNGNTGDKILDSNNRVVWALLQHESGAGDGTSFTDTTPERAQISFVTINATNDDLIACAVADIESTTVNLAYVQRLDLDTYTEQDFLNEQSFVDLSSAGATVDLNNAIDNQGATPATQATDIFVRIDDSSSWHFATSDGAVNLLKVAPAAAGDEVEVNADTFDVNVGAAGTIDFDNGATVDSGGTAINLGVTAGQVDATALKVASTAGAVELESVGGDLILDSAQTVQVDGTDLDADFTDSSHVIMAANDAADKEVRVAARNSGAGEGDLYLEADDDITFETAQETGGIPLDDATTGPISGLFGGTWTSIADAIDHAGTIGGSDLAMKLSVLGSNYSNGTNIPAVTLDLTSYTLDMSSDTATVFVFLNGRLLRGAAGSGTGDVYPGDTPASGDLKHDFPKPFKNGDVLISMGFSS